MIELDHQVEEAVSRHSLLRTGQSVLVAVSGGLDSMVLLHVLHRLAAAQRWRLAVAHFNHGLRGRASDADERLVRQTADKLGLPFFGECAKVKDHARQAGVSVEMAARQLRHEFLAATARAQRIRTIALAHQADDQVELFFLRLLRGAGSAGLAGMKPRSPSPADRRCTLIRPLLKVPKATLYQYARQEHFAFREDASNQSRDFLRNRVRRELLPRLERDYQPALRLVVGRQMEVLRAESEYLDQLARDWLAAPALGAFDRLPVALQRRVVQRQLIAQGLEPDYELIECLRKAEQLVMAGPGLQLWRESDGRVKRRRWEPGSFRTEECSVRLGSAGGEAAFAGVRFRWRFSGQRSTRRPVGKAGNEWFDADRVGDVVVLRHWRPGDRVQPIGLGAAAKLQDLFTNAKIPRERRRQLVVATTADGRIWWVEGLRMAEDFKLRAGTRRRLHWQFSPKSQAREPMAEG